MTSTPQPSSASSHRSVSPGVETPPPGSTQRSRWTPLAIIANIIRGGLIGLAELVPGVSGGTIALVTGVYERVLYNASEFLAQLKLLGSDRKRAIARIKELDWALLLPMAIGMLGIVATMAGVMSSFVSNYPVQSRALFLGMVAASITVPILMISRADLRRKAVPAGVIFAIAAIGTFILTGFSSADKTNPSLILVFFAAAIAICALVLPGVSGSFFLYAVGLYTATTAAVHDRNMVYVAVFALGAITGLALFIRGLEHMLTRHRTLTLIAMAGLMCGSLRALWPWQTESAELLAPQGSVLPALLLCALGVALVGGMVIAERRLSADPNVGSQTVQ